MSPATDFRKARAAAIAAADPHRLELQASIRNAVQKFISATGFKPTVDIHVCDVSTMNTEFPPEYVCGHVSVEIHEIT